MGINAATVALLLRTCCIRCAAQKNEGANDKQRGNGYIVTANVLHTMRPPKENAKANGNLRGNGRTVTSNMFYAMPRPKKRPQQTAINAPTLAVSPRTCSIRCPARKKEGANDNQRGNGRTVTANVLHTMARPRTERTSPPLWNFSGGGKNADGPHVLWKMSGSMVDHCPPQAYAKRGASPNEPPALKFVWRS